MADQDQSVMAQYEKPNYVPPPPVDSEFPVRLSSSYENLTVEDNR